MKNVPANDFRKKNLEKIRSTKKSKFIINDYRNKYDNLKSRLPSNYKLTEKENINCSNCYFLKNSEFCKLWKAPVVSDYICNNHLNYKANIEKRKEWKKEFKKSKEYEERQIKWGNDLGHGDIHINEL